jgi:hypothetical protein
MKSTSFSAFYLRQTGGKEDEEGKSVSTGLSGDWML